MCLGPPAVSLDPAEALLDPLAQPLADGVSGMPGGTPVDPSRTPLAGLAEVAVDGDVGVTVRSRKASMSSSARS